MLGGQRWGEVRYTHILHPHVLTQASTHPDSYTIQHFTITDSEQ